MSQLERLAKPFPARLIHNNPSGGGSYVKHSVVTEKLLAVLGPFSFELVEVIRGHVEGIQPNPGGKSARAKAGAPPLDDCVVGAVCRLRVTVDERDVAIEEVGDCESPHNWPHDGARLKDAMSDALKRCAMRLGVTLHLWSGDEFSLYDQIKSAGAGEGPPPRQVDTRPPAPAPTSGAAPRIPAPETVGAPSPPPARTGAPTDLFVPPKATLDNYESRCIALAARGVDIFAARRPKKLPPLKQIVEEWQWLGWGILLDDLEVAADEADRVSA